MNGHIKLRLLAVNTLYWVSMALYTPFIIGYYTQKGISAMQIGVLAAIGPLVSIFIQPFWAYLSDKTHKRRLVLALVAFGSAAGILTYLCSEGFAAYVLATLLLTAFNTSLLPLCDALVTHIAAQNQVDFSRIRIGGTVGYAVTALLVGRFLEGTPVLIFLLGCAGFAAFGLSVLFLPKDEPAPAARERQSGGKVFRTRQIYFVLLIAFLLQVGLSVLGVYYPVLALDLGYGQSIVGLSSCISALSEVPILLFADRLVRRFGAVPLLIFSALMMALRMALCSTGWLPLMLISQLLQSVSYMTSYYSCVRFISENAYPDKISQGQSRLAIVQAGAGTVVGNLLGGWLTDHMGVPAAYRLVAAVVSLLAGLIALAYRRFLRKSNENVA